jgi:hypothetical protein
MKLFSVSTPPKTDTAQSRSEFGNSSLMATALSGPSETEQSPTDTTACTKRLRKLLIRDDIFTDFPQMAAGSKLSLRYFGLSRNPESRCALLALFIHGRRDLWLASMA